MPRLLTAGQKAARTRKARERAEAKQLTKVIKLLAEVTKILKAIR